MFAPEKTLTETGSDPAGAGQATISSSLSETSVDLGFTWRF
jgi:hypothetical protein